MNILVINGPNLNMLGVREKDLYGQQNYNALVDFIKKEGENLGIKTFCFQSNHEGEIIDTIQNAYGKFDGIIINAGGYTHTSIAIMDALSAVSLPAVEVHLTDITKRESFRKLSYISYVSKKTIMGKGFLGYKEALEFFVK